MLNDGSWFDDRAATIAERFFDKLLYHIEGPLAGQPFTLEPWQRSIVRELFGRKRADGLRQYRYLYLEVPRGNGKSTFAAGLALLLLIVDGERSAKVYSAAADRAQAAIVYETAEKMIQASPWLLKEKIRCYRNRTMDHLKSGSKYVVLSSDAYTKHGLNPHGIVFDELHTQPNRDLYDVLNTAMGKRAQPLMIMITTAGHDQNSICYERHEYALKVLSGKVQDPTFLPVIFAADEHDDWTSADTWRKANPNFGVSVKEDFLRQECSVALESPAYQNTFRRLYLNQWTQQAERWLDMMAWDRCNMALPAVAGRTCYGGLDLASTTDVAAFVLAFPPESDDEPMWLLPFFWIPADNIVERERRDRVPYATWVRQGLITATPGNVIDYDYIRNQVLELADLYDLREIAIDPWNATHLTNELTSEGMTMITTPQVMKNMSGPTKEMLRLVLSQRLGHGGNAVLRWMADNVAVIDDSNGNVRPAKDRSSGRIDGIVASVMAVGRAMLHDPDAGKSIYEDRGIVSA